MSWQRNFATQYVLVCFSLLVIYQNQTDYVHPKETRNFECCSGWEIQALLAIGYTISVESHSHHVDQATKEDLDENYLPQVVAKMISDKYQLGFIMMVSNKFMFIQVHWLHAQDMSLASWEAIEGSRKRVERNL